MLVQRFWLLFALFMVIPAVAMGNASLSIASDASDEVTRNVRVLINMERYPCSPPDAQYGLIRRQILDNAHKGLQALGYYHSTLALELVRPANGGCVQAKLNIQAGPPTLLDNIDIQISGPAKDDLAFQTRIANTRLTKGQQLRHDHYTSLRRDLQQMLLTRGYMQGRLTRHQLIIDRDTRTADVELHVDSGPRYYFGEVEIEGSVLNEEMLHKFVRFTPGEPFNANQLLETQQTFLGVNYFSAVRLQRGDPDEENLTVPIDLSLTDSRQWATLAGVGISTDTGPRLRLGVENRRVNRSGHKFRTETELSSVRRAAGASYQIPLQDPLRQRLVFGTRYVKDMTKSVDTERFSVGADYIVELNNRWVATTSIEFLDETFLVAGARDDAQLIIPGFELSRTKSDDPIYPQRGWRLSGKYRFAESSMGSSISFQQVTGSGKLVLPVPGGRFLSRISMGYTEVNRVTSLPASLRFFAGGDSSIRGFGFESIGPRADNGDVVGGRHVIIGSTEYDVPFAQNWSVAVFQDSGNAFNDFNDIEFRHSAGTGIRWRSPLGPIRFDVARALDASRGWRVHLSMGPDL